MSYRALLVTPRDAIRGDIGSTSQRGRRTDAVLDCIPVSGTNRICWATPTFNLGEDTLTQAIGIDLGTTYSAVALVQAGTPMLIENQDGDQLTPSVVLIGAPDDVLVGEMAKRSAALMPSSCVQFVKREMGNANWRFTDPTGAEYTAEQISAAILKRLAAGVASRLGEPVTDVVITVPAYFDDTRRKATQDAGAIAGLNVLRLVNEPTAAAVAYGVTRDKGGLLFVLDLGGGTFDVTLLQADGTDFDVIATDGDRNLGGYNFDNALMAHINRVVQAEGGPDLTDDAVSAADLRERAEIAKRTLTSVPKTQVIVSGKGRTHRIVITRAEFEEMTKPLLDQVEVIVEGVLADAKVTWSQVDHILMVGGSTRMPMIPELIRRLSGKTPETGINPDEAVALGAAILADKVSAESSGTPPLLDIPLSISDVTSQALGTLVLAPDGSLYNQVLIRRNSTVPCAEEKVFGTNIPNQEHMISEITEGEGEDPEYVTVLVRKTIPLPPGLPKGAPMRHIMSYDIDGMVHLEIIDDTSGFTLGEIPLERPLNLKDSEVDAMRTAMRKLEIQ
ncbi:Hsp70 family protein [Nocardia salmonicida]|uniref:Hsp70 family protein n=1 Tax=Nocardia salmonicida TaxID=53431 RepID=UPI0036648F81